MGWRVGLPELLELLELVSQVATLVQAKNRYQISSRYLAEVDSNHCRCRRGDISLSI